MFLRKITLLSSTLLCAGLLHAQSFKLSYEGTELANGAEVTANHYDEISGYVKAIISVTNISSGTKNVKAAKEEISLRPGTISFFCWDQCYTEGVYVSLGALPIEASATNSSFYGEYDPKDNEGNFVEGTSSVKYTFFDENNTSDKVEVIVNYVYGDPTPNSIARGQKANANTKIYQNGNNLKLVFGQNLVSGTKVVIYNVVGKQMYEQNVSGKQETNINTSDFNEGMYILSIIAPNKKVETQKIMIKH